MIGAGYTNPIRGMERRNSPESVTRQFRMPGIGGMGESGLGSLHHTMPHLRRINPSIERMQSGGSYNPVGEAYAASKPNLYNPDPMHRRVLQSVSFNPRNTAFSSPPGSTMQFAYAQGGQSDEEDDSQGGGPDFEDVMQPDDQQSGPDDEERQVVIDAMAALEGEADDPEEALAHFIDTFGPRALKDLQQMVETKHRQSEREDQGDQEGGGEQGGDQDDQSQEAMLDQMGGSPGEEDELAGAGGGLLNGPGTGQSDEIEGTTPSGKPVLLSDGEYVFDAPTVAALGDGSTNAGARRLDELRRQIRRDSYDSDRQAKPMRHGGITIKF